MDAAPTLGARLQQWLARLDGAGFAVGVRERLVVQQLLVQQAGAGLLNEPWPQLLARLAPLLCTSPQQQADYQRLLQVFVAEQAPAGPGPGPVWRRRWLLHAALAAVVVAGGAAAWRTLSPDPEPCVANCAPARGGEVAPTPPPPPPPPPAVQGPVYVPQGQLPLQPSSVQPAPWSGLLVLAVRAAAVLALLVVALWLWRWRPPPVVLQQRRTDAALDEHVLRAAPDPALQPHPGATRAVAAALRQRVAGDTQVLDVSATLRATLRAGGALAPRYRALKRTPEYLVLIDQRQPLDHAAAYARTLVHALREAGVTLAVWCYEGTPDDGLWPAQAEAALSERERLWAFAEVVARHPGHRLLVLGSCGALLTPVGGRPRAWLQGLGLLAQRAWFTPLPLHAWGGAETAVEDHGFLLLPLQEGALPTLAGWLSSDQLTLAVPADWPLAYPALLAGDAQQWVTRQSAPPPEAMEALLRELQLSLGPTRWRWLCACAVFPGLAPALTLSLGREVLREAGEADDERALVLGYTALAALPWFRESFMPPWLRQALVASLEPALKARVRALLQARIDAAAAEPAAPGVTDVLAQVAVQRPGPARRARSARDVLLARFLAGDEAADELDHRVDTVPLARRLGLRLRRLAALPRWAWPPLVVLGVAAVVSATDWWPQISLNLPQAPLQALGEPIGDVNPASALAGLAYSPDGTQLYLALAESQNAVPDAPRLVVDARNGQPQTRALLAWAPTRTTVVRSEDSAIEARLAADGTLGLVRVADNTPIGLPLGGPYTALALSPDGRRLAARRPDGRVQRWGTPYGVRVEWVGCAAQPVVPSLGVMLAESMQNALVASAGVVGQTSRLDVDHVAYAAPAWQILHGRSAPEPRQIVHGPGLDQAAETLREFLSGNPATAAAGWQRRSDAAFEGRIAIGLCLATAALAPAPGAIPVEGLPPVEVKALQDRVEAMFSGDPSRRVAATEALMRDPARYSDAVPLALQRAWDVQSAGVSPGSPQMDGVYNTLVLLSVAMPATLNRHAELVRRLVEAASSNGELTANRGQKVLERLVAGQARRPLVYVQHGGPTQRGRAQSLLAPLRGLGVDAPAVEDTGVSRQPARTQLRVQGLADRVVARRVAALAQQQLGVPVELTATPERLTRPGVTDTYELWLGADVAGDAESGAPVTVQIALCAAESGPKPSARSQRVAESLARSLPRLGARGQVTQVVLDPATSASERQVFEANSWGGAIVYNPINEPRTSAPGRAAGTELQRLLGMGIEARPETPASADIGVIVCPPDAAPTPAAKKASPATLPAKK